MVENTTQSRNDNVLPDVNKNSPLPVRIADRLLKNTDKQISPLANNVIDVKVDDEVYKPIHIYFNGEYLIVSYHSEVESFGLPDPSIKYKHNKNNGWKIVEVKAFEKTDVVELIDIASGTDI
jgi:hypothetical protein